MVNASPGTNPSRRPCKYFSTRWQATSYCQVEQERYIPEQMTNIPIPTKAAHNERSGVYRISHIKKRPHEGGGAAVSHHTPSTQIGNPLHPTIFRSPFSRFPIHVLFEKDCSAR